MIYREYRKPEPRSRIREKSQEKDTQSLSKEHCTMKSRERETALFSLGIVSDGVIGSLTGSRMKREGERIRVDSVGLSWAIKSID